MTVRDAVPATSGAASADAASPPAPHSLHAATRTWQETNCYLDLWIELLHGLGLDPVPMLVACASADFDDDQWTFCKPSATELNELYGLEVQELTIWRALPAHLATHVRAGRIPLVEVDAYALPDTAGVSYGIEHAKTTIAVLALDPDARHLAYLHNAGRFALDGDRFETFMGTLDSSFPLPPFCEVVKCGRQVQRESADLASRTRRLLASRVAAAPPSNPVERLATALTGTVRELGGDMRAFHQYAFATLRQAGACAELTASLCDWLADRGDGTLREASRDWQEIATTMKALEFRLARAVARQAEFDAPAHLEATARTWDRAMAVMRHVGDHGR